MVLSYLRFYNNRLFRTHRIAFVLLIAGAVGVCLATIFYLQQRQILSSAQHELRMLVKSLADAKSLQDTTKQPQNSAIKLPRFDSVELVQTLNELAAETRAPVDDVAYAIDSAASDPYLRYRITLDVAAEYAVIRNFGARLVSEMPNVSMDSISCKRTDTATAPLTCDLQFSAFYERGQGG